MACHKEAETSTTRQIPLSNNTMLVISDHKVEIVKDYNSNDNAISRIPQSTIKSVQKVQFSTPIQSTKEEVNKSIIVQRTPH